MDTLTLLGIAVVVLVQYTLWFWIHFSLLPLSGGGDGFMPMEFQQTLVVRGEGGEGRTPLFAVAVARVCASSVSLQPCLSRGVVCLFVCSFLLLHSTR